MHSNLFNHHPLHIIGTGGLAREMAHWITQNNQINIQFVEPNQFSQIPKSSYCVIGFAIPEYRKKFFDTYDIESMIWPYFIHPTVFLGGKNTIGRGTVIYPNVYIGHESHLGEFVFVHQKVNIGHNCQIGNHNLINPTTSIGGGTVLGENVNIGMSTTIKDLVTVCNNCEFLMTSVVTKNIDNPGQYYGNRKTHG